MLERLRLGRWYANEMGWRRLGSSDRQTVVGIELGKCMTSGELMNTPLSIILLATAFILIIIAFVPTPKDDDNDYNGKDSQP